VLARKDRDRQLIECELYNLIDAWHHLSVSVNTFNSSSLSSGKRPPRPSHGMWGAKAWENWWGFGLLTGLKRPLSVHGPSSLAETSSIFVSSPKLPLPQSLWKEEKANLMVQKINMSVPVGVLEKFPRAVRANTRNKTGAILRWIMPRSSAFCSSYTLTRLGSSGCLPVGSWLSAKLRKRSRPHTSREENPGWVRDYLVYRSRGSKPVDLKRNCRDVLHSIVIRARSSAGNLLSLQRVFTNR